jgi:3-dehydroquinate dehydratase-1
VVGLGLKNRKPIVIASLPIRSPQDLLKIGIADDADLVEVRLDYMDNPLSIEPDLLARFRDRIIVTIRDRSEGGLREVDEHLKAEYLSRLDKLGLLYDVEISFVEKHRIPYDGKILSIHYISRLPTKEEIISRINVYAEKAFVIKIAVNNMKGYKELLASLLEAGYDNIAVMPMGSDPLERIALTLMGSKLIYGYIETPTAPGQMHYKEILRIFRCIYGS